MAPTSVPGCWAAWADFALILVGQVLRSRHLEVTQTVSIGRMSEWGSEGAETE